MMSGCDDIRIPVSIDITRSCRSTPHVGANLVAFGFPICISRCAILA